MTVILRKYYQGDSLQPNFKELRRYFKANNPLLNEFLGTGVGLDISKAELDKLQAISFKPAAVGGVNVVNIADGLAKFLVERTKAELNIAFFRKFKEDLQAPENEPLRLLMPHTYSTLLIIDEEIYNYSYYLQALRAAFQKDLSSLFPSLSRFMNLTKYDSLAMADPAFAIARKLLTPANMFINGEHATEILSQLASTNFKNSDLQDLESGLQIVNLISQSALARDSESRGWISVNDFRDLVETEFALQIFAGLLYEQAGTIGPISTSGLTFRQALVHLKQESDKFLVLRSHFERFVFHADLIDETIKRISANRKAGQETYQDYFVISQAPMDIIRESIHFKAVLGEPGKNDETFLQLLAFTNELNMDIKLKNYSAAVINTAGLLYAAFGQKNEKLKRKVIKYGSFMAAVAKAETSDDVKKAIEAIALPVGSASIKKQSIFNISLNSYVGGFLGRERLKAFDEKLKMGNFWKPNAFGVWAPLGIALSRGIACGKSRSAISLFASVFDIGALTAFRFKDDTASLPETQLKNIFAPGLYLNWGLPRWPLSLGFGFQVGPNLREIKISEQVTQPVAASGFRFSFVAAVDIPIINFYSSSRD